MKSHVQAAVIGGGVVGCSVLYHLTKLGWHDVVLLERTELTAGSTWHAAGGMHTLNSDANISKLQGYTIDLYHEIEEISGQACGLHQPGGLYLAATPERLDFLKAERAKARYLGLELEFIDLADIHKVNPLINTANLTGALFDPNDGHVDPNGVTQAYAKAARMAGADVYRQTPVVELNPTPDGGWQVVTPQGSIEAEVVVNAAGLWAREVGKLAGVDLPVLPMEHQYLVTDDIAEVAALEREAAHTIDFEGESYLRQEGKGILIGTYEQGCRAWSADGTPSDFGHELLESDLDRIMDNLAVAYDRYPCLAEAGIKRIINGPMVFAPDGNPLIGPTPGLKNFFQACGVMAGFSQGGGVGLSVAEWVVEGEPGMDVFAMDVSRFGDYATKGYVNDKVYENYRRRFTITFPNEELPAGRPVHASPAYDRLAARGAVFGAAFGLEHALWFAPDGGEAVETPTFRRSNAFEPVAAECQAVRNGVGILELCNYAKYEITGPGAEAWLDRLLANRLPKDGRLSLSPMLSPKGRLMGDFTVARMGPERFFIFGSGIAEAFHLRWFAQHLPDQGVTVHSVTRSFGGFAVAGPASRELLTRLCDADLSQAAFRFFRIAEMDVGPANAIVARVSYTGDLGYEVYVPAEQHAVLYNTLMDAGADLGVRPFGGRALNSLRLEKGFGSWMRDFTPDYTAFEAGLDRFVDTDRNADFIGRGAVMEQRNVPPKRRLATLVVDADDADVYGDEPVFHDGEVVGFVTSGGYAHYVGESVALAYLPPALIQAGSTFEVEILGDRRPARYATKPLFDPEATRMVG